jgi:hypothetical protein
MPNKEKKVKKTTVVTTTTEETTTSNEKTHQNILDFTDLGAGINNVSATLNNVSKYYRSVSTSDATYSANSDSLMDNFKVDDNK